MKQLLVVVLIVVGLIGVAVGIVYLVDPSSSLPSFFPGHVGHAAGAVAGAVKHRKKGIGGVVLGAVLVAIGLIIQVTGKAPARS
ncbi:MAG: hypothetical protein ACYDD4_00640 [Acidimicrobiales bacterium]